MKKLLIPISFCLLVFTTATAQEKRGNKKGDFKREIFKNLNLTPQQQEKAKSIRKEFKEKQQALNNNSTITLGEFRQKQQELKEQQKQQFEAILTNEQKTILATEKQQRKAIQQQRMANRFEKFKTELNLTSTQQQSIKAKQDQLQQQIVTIKENKSLNAQQKHEQVKQLHKAQNEYVKSVLTTEQLQKFESLKKRKNNMTSKRK